jgi:hypothetical protein
MQGDDSMRDDQKATLNGLRLLEHTQGNGAGPATVRPGKTAGHLAERVIAAFRRGGLGCCCVTISEDETLH